MSDVEKETVVVGNTEAVVEQPLTHKYNVLVVAIDGHEDYIIEREVVAWSVSAARTLVLMKDNRETLVMTAKSWKTIEVIRDDFVASEDKTNKRRVDTDMGNSDYFDFIQIDNTIGIIQGMDGNPEEPTRFVTYNPQFVDFLVITNS